MRNVGNCFFYGTGVQQDKERAVQWYHKAADKGNTSALYEIAEYYIDKKDYKNAYEYYLRSAEAGNMWGQCRLGRFLLIAEPTAADGSQKPDEYVNPEEGFKWILKAAEQGFPAAMASAADCYYRGRGTQKNDKKAREWAEKAINSSDAYAADDAEYVMHWLDGDTDYGVSPSVRVK